jgi:DNA repair protein RecO
MVELTEILFPWGVADRNMFDLLKGSLDALAEKDKSEIIPFIFEIKAMTLGGYGINLEKCSICGRPYKGEGRAVLKRDKGGIACLKCHQESAISPGLDPQSVEMIKLMQTDPLRSLIKLQLTEEITKEIRTVLKLHREYHLGQRPKTANYLD